MARRSKPVSTASGGSKRAAPALRAHTPPATPTRTQPPVRASFGVLGAYKARQAAIQAGTLAPRSRNRPAAARAAAYSFDSDQGDNIFTVLKVGYAMGAPRLALMAALCIGSGENNFHTEGCNGDGACGCPRGCCGFWQNDCAQQARHDYHDVGYWAEVAFRSGLWIYGGIITIARDHPNYSPGYIANMCQGAYSNLSQGGAYYDGQLTIATYAYDQYWPGVVGVGKTKLPPVPGAGPQPGETVPSAVVSGDVESLVKELDYAGADVNLWKELSGAAGNVASSAQSFLRKTQRITYVKPHKAG